MSIVNSVAGEAAALGRILVNYESNHGHGAHLWDSETLPLDGPLATMLNMSDLKEVLERYWVKHEIWCINVLKQSEEVLTLLGSSKCQTAIMSVWITSKHA